METEEMSGEKGEIVLEELKDALAKKKFRCPFCGSKSFIVSGRIQRNCSYWLIVRDGDVSEEWFDESDESTCFIDFLECKNCSREIDLEELGKR